MAKKFDPKKAAEKAAKSQACNPSRTPEITMHAYFVSYGYQVDIFVDGKGVETLCRDFGGDHTYKKLKKDMIEQIHDMLDRFREGK